LVVEDEAIVALDLTERLTRLGYRVVGAVATGEEAIVNAAEHRPDLVLMDVRLAGEIDGTEAAGKIRELGDIPVVYLTAHSDPQTIARVTSSEPFGYILKPFAERELHIQIEIALYRHSAERRVRESEEQMRTIMDTAQDGIMAVDARGTIVSVNPALGEIFGYGEEELIGRDVSALLPGFGRLMEKDDAHWCLRTRDGKVLGSVREFTGRRKDQSEIPLEIALSRKSGLHRGNYIAIVRDLRRRKRLEQELKKRVEELRELDRRKDEFLATLSHELRNPLAPIRNAATILKRADIGEPKLRWCCDIIDEQVAQMSRIMEDLLDISRITRGQLEVRKQWVQLAEVVNNALDACRPLIEGAGHSVSVNLPAGETQLFADGARLSQVLCNLIANAAKYMDVNGRIELSARIEGEQIAIAVRDWGIGIAPEFLPRLFEMFSQADSRLERSRGGLGIGLAVVRSLVDLQGGTVEAFSAGPAQGSTFTVRLPYAANAPQSAEQTKSKIDKPVEPQETAAPAKRVLIVDDNQMQARSLGMLLELWGCEVRLAYDAPGALAALNSFAADAALIDIGLPGMNGHDLARQIRAAPQWRGIKLVAQTGWGRDSDFERSTQAGFDHHLTKPIDHQSLAKMLRG